MAGFGIEDHAVFDAVERIALVEDPFDHRLPVAVGESILGARLTLIILRRNLVQRGGNPAIANARIAGAHGGRAGDDAVEVGGIAFGHQHRFAAPGRTAGEIGVVDRLAVMLRDDALRDFSHAADGDVREVEAGLLILLEAAVEPAFALMAGVGTCDCEAARESGIATGRTCAEGKLHRAIEAAAALQQKTSIPVLRQRDGEADAVSRAVGSGSLVNHSIDAAVRRQFHRRSRASTSGRRRSGGKPLGLRDGKIHARHLQLFQRRACGGVGVCAECASAHYKQNGHYLRATFFHSLLLVRQQNCTLFRRVDGTREASD